MFAAALLLSVSACTSLVHKQHSSNSYETDFNATVSNKSLKFSMSSPADIAYTADAENIKASAKRWNVKLSNVLVHGVAQQHHPFYEFFLLYNPKKVNTPEQVLYLKDTLINEQRLVLMAFPLEENINKAVQNDFEGIFKSIEID